MRPLVVIQARMGSTRLPGKVLQPLAGRPMLVFMLERLASLSPAANVVVATGSLPIDDAVAATAGEAGVAVVRGPEADVLGRFVVALELAGPADVVVRLTADCPLSDPALVRAALDLHAETGADYTSNTLVRTFPNGLDVEVVSAAALRDAAREAEDPAEREHVTPFVYRRPERYRLAALRWPDPLGDERWTVDTFDDMERVRAIVARLPEPVTAGWRDVLAVAGRSGPAGGAPLRPAPDSTPAIRRWTVVRDGSPVGWAEVSVRGGIGRLRGELEEDRGDALLNLVRRALAADCQVVTLVDERIRTGRNDG